MSGVVLNDHRGIIGHFVKFVGNYVLHEVFDCDRHYDFLLLVNSFNI